MNWTRVWKPSIFLTINKKVLRICLLRTVFYFIQYFFKKSAMKKSLDFKLHFITIDAVSLIDIQRPILYLKEIIQFLDESEDNY